MQETPREIELKLDIDPSDVSRLKRLPLMRPEHRGNGRPQELRSVYFDTEDLDLHAAGVELRVRHVGKRRMQTLKARSGAAMGLFDRLEWEKPLAGDRPDLSDMADTQLRAILGRNPAKLHLKPIFETRIRRSPRRIVHGGSEIEASIDEGAIEDGTSCVNVHELELELKRGDPAELFQLAGELSQKIGVRLGIDSKAARGYALRTPRDRHAAKAGHPVLRPDMPARAAFQEIGRACLGHLLLNERLLREAPNPEAVHQMRVATRRLRAAMSCFKPLLGSEDGAFLKGELKWLAGELAAARNLDVFIASMLDPLRARGESEPGIDDLAAFIQERRDKAYPTALEAARSPRCRELALQLFAWFETGPWLHGPDQARLAAPILTLAAKELGRRRKRFKKRLAIGALSAEEWHALRIRAKKLRYAVEFFGGLYDGGKARKRRKACTAALVRLQDELGALNDIVEAERMLADIAAESGDRHPRRAFAAGLVAGHARARIEGLTAKADATYEELRRIKPFWA